ncbi:MAG: hypothetical protein IJO51_09395, partial [Clostridia bacterium]|nr:hypothetical protein [Clostridia bacterium]
ELLNSAGLNLDSKDERCLKLETKDKKFQLIFAINLFVAKFLGTPPINVFHAEVRSGKLWIGEEEVMAVPGAANGEIYAAIRPEGLVPDENGALTCELIEVEVMGRDKTVVSRHALSENVEIRAIVRSDSHVDIADQAVRFSLLPNKVFLFEKTTGQRIHFAR